MGYLAFNNASITDGGSYSTGIPATSIKVNDGGEVIKIVNTKTSNKRQNLKGTEEATFEVGYDYDSSIAPYKFGDTPTITGTLTSGKTFVIDGMVESNDMSAGAGGKWECTMKLVGNMTTRVS